MTSPPTTATSTTTATTSTTTTTTTGTTSAPTMAPCDQDNPSHTVGMIACTPDAWLGYTLFAPIPNQDTWLIDIHGELVHHWEHDSRPGVSVYLEPSGHLLRTGKRSNGTRFDGAGGAGGLVQEVDWDGTVLWEFEYASDEVLQHHDIERLPSGNVLLVAWEYFSEAEAEALGRDPSLVDADGLWIDHLIEVDPATDAIVWEWHLSDHLVQDFDPSAPGFGVPANEPFRVDLNRAGSAKADWTHINGVDYDPVHDHIVLSVHGLDELWIIDHAPDTQAAAGPAGDLLYRWGNAFNHGVGMLGDRVLDNQHDTEFIAEGLPGAGNLLVFNNGVRWEESAVLELELPRDGDGFTFDGITFGPEAPTWEYRDPGVMYSNFIGGSQRLANGHTLVTEGDDGRLIEVTEDGTIVWEYIVPVGNTGPVYQGDTFDDNGLGNATFRGDRYGLDYPAFAGRDLTPQGPIEQ